MLTTINADNLILTLRTSTREINWTGRDREDSNPRRGSRSMIDKITYRA